jgi:signal transduction histidine kinase
MLHKTQTRLVFVLLVAIGALAGGLVLYQRAERARIHRFFLQRVQEENATLDKLLELKGASLEMFAVDYTYWDEMVRCIQEKDIAWADENIAEALGTYQAQVAWVYRPDRSLVYAARDEEQKLLAGFTLPEDAMELFQPDGRFWRFFIQSPAGPLEIRAATVHPSSDPDRKTPPQGYFVVGRLWNQAYVAELARLTVSTMQMGARGKLRVAGYELREEKGERSGIITMERTLEGWDRAPVAVLDAQMISYAVQEYNRSSAQQFGMLVLFAVMTIGLISVALVFYVTRPLSLLSRSLSTEKPEMLGRLRSDKSEFGLLGRLVTRFFEQKGELVKEIAERKLAMTTLAAKEEELRRSNTELEQFAYVASHDLQEPLRMVGSYTQLLSRRYKGKLDADADEFIAFAVDGVTRMQRLINDLLQYSRVGTKGREPVPTQSETVLERALANLRIAIDDNKATVTHDPLPMVLADDRQLEQLFQNLVGNAIKFHGNEPPRVHIRAERSNGCWMFAVKDNGIGIEPQYFDRIFQVFQRLHTMKEYAGTGIGLAVCKKIVERHGGRIWVESEPGKGTSFQFTLPAAGKEQS